MNELDLDLVAIGDQLQGAWRRDRRHERRRTRVLAVAAVATVLAVTGAALAAGVLPISVTSTSGTPSPRALVHLRALYPQAPEATPRPFPGSLALRLDRASVVGRIDGLSKARLDVLVIPATPRGVCLDLARPDGSAFMSGCTTFAHQVVDRAGRRSTAFQTTLGRDATAAAGALSVTLRTAPPGAVRADVRTRSSARVPSILENGWLVYVNQHPGPAVLVRFYDTHGTRLLSYEGS